MAVLSLLPEILRKVSEYWTEKFDETSVGISGENMPSERASFLVILTSTEVIIAAR
jgi:hypothetical protein